MMVVRKCRTKKCFNKATSKTGFCNDCLCEVEVKASSVIKPTKK